MALGTYDTFRKWCIGFCAKQEKREAKIESERKEAEFIRKQDKKMEQDFKQQMKGYEKTGLDALLNNRFAVVEARITNNFEMIVKNMAAR